MIHNKENHLSLAGRTLLSLLFLYAGIGKLMAPSATIAYIANAGFPFPTLAYAAALLVELGCATTLLLGYRTAVSAAVMAIFTLLAGLIFHSNFSEKMQLISFLKNIAICGGLLQVIASKPSAFSLDAKRLQKSDSRHVGLST